MNEENIEKQIQDKRLTAPRVTPDQIDSLMDDVNVHCYIVPGTTTTVATAFLSNGFTLGCEFSACASPENFDAAIGISIAKGNVLATARKKLWELEGYSLKCELDMH
tara:strand:+ start:1219 stop:1539 length:321 start_codon:yes stop_codon:yes gene_type:complete